MTETITTTDAARQQVLQESGSRCCMCAAHIGFQVEVAPITPLNEGGVFNPPNLAVLCPFCRWLVQRQRVSPSALRTFKKNWADKARHAAEAHKEAGVRIEGQPLRMEAVHHNRLTVLEGSELTTLLANFFNCLDTFLIHEDQHLENAASLAVIRAFRDMYDYVPPEQEIKELATADSRKLDLLYKGIRILFTAGLTGRARPAPVSAKTAKPAKHAAAKAPAKTKAPANTKARKPAAKPAKRKAAARPKPKKR